MAKFLDRVKTYSYLDAEKQQPGRTGNFTYVEPSVINDPIYLEMVVSPDETLNISAFKTNISNLIPTANGGYEIYQGMVKSGWDIDLTEQIGSLTVSSRVNKKILDDLTVSPEYENTGLREQLLKTTDSIGHFLGWDSLYISSGVAGHKHKVSAVEKVKSTFDKIKDRLTGHKPEAPEYKAKSNLEILEELGYISTTPSSAEVAPMVGHPNKSGILQPDILETLAGRTLNGTPITESDNFSPRFQFVYRILDKDLNDLMASHSLHY